MAKLLLVDDDEQVLIAVEAYFRSIGFTCECVLNGREAEKCLTEGTYDAVILDWMLPGKNGYDICVQYRESGGQLPIIFLTGKDDLSALELALGAGGDDYICKPFNVHELHARLKAVLRRGNKPFVSKLSVGDVVLYPESATLEAGDKKVTLRNKETAILELLMSKPNVTHSVADIIAAVWPADTEPTTSSVRVWINFLRQRLETIGAANLIETVPGFGYIIRAD